MDLEKIISAFFLVAVLILVLPEFLSSNSSKNQFLKNILIWSIIVAFVVVLSLLIF